MRRIVKGDGVKNCSSDLSFSHKDQKQTKMESCRVQRREQKKSIVEVNKWQGSDLAGGVAGLVDDAKILSSV